MFAILETFFGIGMIMGPTVGGALYELGGFTLPFVSLGGKFRIFRNLGPYPQHFIFIVT
jgi:hypothetical protein